MKPVTLITAMVLGAFAAVSSAAPPLLAKWGTSGAGPGQFNSPLGIAIDGSGDVYVADTYNHRIQVFSPDGTFLRQWGGYGAGNDQLGYPKGMAFGPDGYLYVAETGFTADATARVHVFTSTGSYVRQWGSHGTAAGEFQGPFGIVVDQSGYVFVSDAGLDNNYIHKFTSDGTFIFRWGTNGAVSIWSPFGLTLGAQGDLYVCDRGWQVQEYTRDSLFVRQWGTQGSGDGQFWSTSGVAADRDGNIYVTDAMGDCVQVFTSDGTYLDRWGTQGTGDGQFQQPIGIAIDAAGSVYVVDSANNRIQKFGRPATPATKTSWGRLKGLYR